jgi:hypothetical protein
MDEHHTNAALDGANDEAWIAVRPGKAPDGSCLPLER